jgi:hypothetical protein
MLYIFVNIKFNNEHGGCGDKEKGVGRGNDIMRKYTSEFLGGTNLLYK